MLEFFFEGSTNLFSLIFEQAGGLQVWWEKKSQKPKRACSFIIEFRVFEISFHLKI